MDFSHTAKLDEDVVWVLNSTYLGYDDKEYPARYTCEQQHEDGKIINGAGEFCRNGVWVDVCEPSEDINDMMEKEINDGNAVMI